MLSKTAQYALRAVVLLARNAQDNGNGRMRLDSIAEELGVPRNYLSKVMHGLARDGILESSRGPTGGFRLAVPAEELTLSRVIETVDDAGGAFGCLLRDGPCTPDRPCVAHHRWKDLAVEVREFFAETTLAELLNGARASAVPIIF